MKPSDLRGILQYVPRFRDRIFVIAVDGRIAASENFGNVLMDIAVLRSLSIRVILVHGAGHQIERLAQQRGVALSNTDGTGITDAPTLQVAIDASTRLTHDIMQGLASLDIRAAFANSLIAHPAGILAGVDQLHTGKIEKVDTVYLDLMLREGILPVIPPVAYDGEGRTFRVNSDTVAVEIARAMTAAKILYLSASDGIPDNGHIARQLSVAEAEETLKRDALKRDPALSSKLRNAARACRDGVARVHLINGTLDEALLAEVFSNEGVGTMVYSNEYQQIRRLYKKDIRTVLRLMRQSVASEELLKRTREDILAHLGDYWVLEIDNNIVGCVALIGYPESGVAELSNLFVSSAHENQGIGSKLMAFATDTARTRGFQTVVALSTQAFEYLKRKGGFEEAAVDILPTTRRESYEANGRRSRILRKSVG